VLGALDAQLAGIERCLIELDAGIAVAFDPVFDPHEQLGIDRLRAGVTAEQAAGNRRYQEQRIGGNNEQGGQVNDILWPEDGTENVELAFDEVEQDGLATVPFQPQAAVENDLGKKDKGDAPVVEKTADALGVDFLALFVERYFRDGFCLRVRFRIAHGFSVGFLFVRSETGAGTRAICQHKACLRGELRGICRQIACRCQHLLVPVVRKAPRAGGSGFRSDVYQDACLLFVSKKLKLNQLLVFCWWHLSCQLPGRCVNNGGNNWLMVTNLT